MAGRPNKNQLAALHAVADGRVQWGSAYPARDRRLGVSGVNEFLVDGIEVYGQQKSVYAALSRRELIRERTEDIETEAAPPEDRRYTNIIGVVTVHHLPERQVPVDPGWRVAVELTATGRAMLDRERERPVTADQHDVGRGGSHQCICDGATFFSNEANAARFPFLVHPDCPMHWRVGSRG